MFTGTGDNNLELLFLQISISGGSYFLSSIGSGITFLSFAIFFPVFANDIQDPIEELKDIIHLDNHQSFKLFHDYKCLNKKEIE